MAISPFPAEINSRPPIVMFELRAVEDRDATLEAGSPQYRDEPYAIVSAPGGKDVIERPAAGWFAYIERAAQSGRFPYAWVDAFRKMFEDWQAGVTGVTNGMPVRECLAFTPAEQKALLEANLPTVEDVAEANTEAMARVGAMSLRLKNRAKKILEESRSVGSVAMENEKLRVQLDAQTTRVNELSELVTKLESKLDLLAGREAPSPRRRNS